MILFANTEIEVHAEPESQRVEVGLAAFHGRGALALQIPDFPGIHGLGIAEEIPRGLAGSVVGAVAEIRTGDNTQVLVRKHIQRRTDRIVRAAHDEGRALSEFDGEVLQRGRDQQVTRFHADRLPVAVHLIEKQLDGLLETVGAQCAGRSGEQIPVGGGEQRLAVLLRGIAEQTGEEQLVDQPCGAVAHRHGDFHERPQIIVDDHLARQA